MESDIHIDPPPDTIAQIQPESVLPDPSISSPNNQSRFVSSGTGSAEIVSNGPGFRSVETPTPNTPDTVKPKETSVSVANKAIVALDPGRVTFGVYVYNTKRTMSLTVERKALIDCFAESDFTKFNVAEATRRVNAALGKNRAPGTVWRWAQMSPVRDYIVQRMRDKALVGGMTEERWKAMGIDAMVGGDNTSLNGFYWKELGKAMGYYKDPQGTAVASAPVQINIMQADGTK